MKLRKWMAGAVIAANVFALAGCGTQAGRVTTEEAASSYDAEDIVPAREDFTQFSALTVGSDGYLHLPDNTTTESLAAVKLAVRHIKFALPGSWQADTVVRTSYIDDAGADPETNTYGFVHDTEIVSFYEKTAFESVYHTGTLTSENAENGRLASLYIVNTEKNDLSAIAADYRNVFLGQVQDGGTAYALFLTSPDIPADVSGSAYETGYKRMTEAVDYMGAIVSTIKTDEGASFSCANSYIKNRYVLDVDAMGPGMAEGSALPEIAASSSRAGEDQMPAGVANSASTQKGMASYPWTAFVSPFSYTDGTSAPAPTPAVTETPTPSPTPTETPAPSSAPSVVPTETPSPEPTVSPTETPTETPVPGNAEGREETAGEEESR